MGEDAFTDRALLRTNAYADAEKFTARVGIYRYQVPNIDFGAWALDHLPQELGSVLDVGCGPGAYLARLSRSGRVGALVGVDLSEGMLRDVPPCDAMLSVADAQALPFPDASFDTVVCMHMLYHAPDIDQAVRELRRTRRRGGTVLIATNGEHHHGALRAAFDEVVTRLAGRPVRSILTSARRFRLESGADVIRPHFDYVERHDLVRELVVPDAGPVLAYLDSIRSFHEATLPPEVRWDDARTAFADRVQREIDREGAFRSATVAGVFVCR